MQLVLKSIPYVLFAILLFGGITDVAQYFRSGSPINWAFLIIILCLLAGSSFLIEVFYYQTESSENQETTENDSDNS
jgi:hypothetical protein